jgi:hypothetical protein
VGVGLLPFTLIQAGSSWRLAPNFSNNGVLHELDGCLSILVYFARSALKYKVFSLPRVALRYWILPQIIACS